MCPKKGELKSRYTWSDLPYEEFIRELFNKLEPRYEKAGKIIVYELDEMPEVMFFTTGKYNVGYLLNNKETYVL